MWRGVLVLANGARLQEMTAAWHHGLELTRFTLCIFCFSSKFCIFFWLNIFHTFCTYLMPTLCIRNNFYLPFPDLKKQIRSDNMTRFKEFWVHVKCVQFCKEAENDELATLNLKCGYNARLGGPTPTFLSRSIWAAWSPLLPISSHLSQKNEEHKTHAQTQTDIKHTSTYIWAAWSLMIPHLYTLNTK